MITEESVMVALAAANPVPDVDELDLALLGTASYLATLEQRSSEVTHLDTKTRAPKEKSSRRLTVTVAVAAVLAVILGVVVVLSQDDAEPVIDDPVVTTIPEDSSADVALLDARTAFLTRFAEASNSGDVGEAFSMFNKGSFPPEIRRHPYGFGTFWDSAAVRNGLELMVEAQGSGTGVQFRDIEVSDGSSASIPDISFNWRFDYGADGSEAGGVAGCIGGENGKIFLRQGLITSFDWGFDDPSQCDR